MDLYEKIKLLAEGQKISIRRLEENLGYGNGTIRRWEKQTPGIDKVQSVADYFNVSVDYLLGREESTTQKETELRKALENVMSFDGEELTENDKDAIIAYMMGRKGK